MKLLPKIKKQNKIIQYIIHICVCIFMHKFEVEKENNFSFVKFGINLFI